MKDHRTALHYAENTVVTQLQSHILVPSAIAHLPARAILSGTSVCTPEKSPTNASGVEKDSYVWILGRGTGTIVPSAFVSTRAPPDHCLFSPCIMLRCFSQKTSVYDKVCP
jgi:hypothetical protein